MTVWFITPWHGATERLLPEYIKATKGGRVVAIDNATPEATSKALRAAADEHGWHLIRNEENRGFSTANNQGWRYVEKKGQPSDVVCFLNSDVRADGLATALEGNVRDGGLYGPSLGRQLVLGRWIPYLEGWCIAAKLGSWWHLESLGFTTSANYDELWPNNYGPAYWEDNCLCLRAMGEAGYALVHLQLPVQHLGGQSGGIANMGEVLEQNRALFVEEVRGYLDYPKPKDTPVRQRYLRELQTDSDIRHHLPLLYSVGRGLIVELGTRTGVSTAAFLAAAEMRGGHVVSVDIADVSALYRGHPLWTCIQADSRHPELPAAARKAADGKPIDVLLIDTEHIYEQVTAELLLWAEHVKPGGYILCHDTETFPGVRGAIEDWVRGEAPEGTTVTYVLPNNGMGIIRLGGK